MKRYKLKKDAPCAKAGIVFEERVDEFDGKILINEEFKYKIIVDCVDNFDDWFEEIPEYKRWRGERGDSYYFIDDEGAIRHEIDTNDGMDNYRYNIGNYFKTEAEAESYKKYLTARQVLLADAEGGKCIEYGKNWHAYYDTITKTYRPVCSISYFYPGIIHFRTEEALKKSLKEHEEQWDIVRKYEMGEM